MSAFKGVDIEDAVHADRWGSQRSGSSGPLPSNTCSAAFLSPNTPLASDR